MSDNQSILDSDLDYAARMVLKGFGSPEQASQVCGVRLADLQARLAEHTKAPAAPEV